MATEISLRVVVNGTDHSFQRELGCDCGRCLNPSFRGNTSVSLIAVSGYNDLVWHGLIDAGAGVVNNLWDNLHIYRGEPRVDSLFLTHWHPDHTIGLNQLCETLRRSRTRLGLSNEPIPLWARSETMKRVRERHPFEVERFLRPINDAVDNKDPGHLLEPLKFSDIRVEVQPVAISHGTAGPSSTAGFVITGPTGRRAGLIWDLDNQNDWVLAPSESTKDACEALHRLDVLFMDCNTWRVEEVNGRNTGHLAFERLWRYAKALRPRETILIHLSGHEDGPGAPGWGWSNAEWELAARRHWADGPGHVSVLDPGDFRVV